LYPLAFALLTSLPATVDAGGTSPSPTGGDDVADAAKAPPPAKTAAEPRLPADAFTIERQPRARRTQKWTRPRRDFSPRWERDYPQKHFSRFLDLARPDFHPPKARTLTPSEWQTSLFRFAGAVIADLHEAVQIACARRRCAPALAEAEERLAAFVGTRDRAFSPVDRKARSDRWNAWYGWRLSGGTASFELGCNDMLEAPEVTCRLELELDDGLVLGYAPKNWLSGPEPEITLWRQGDGQKKPLGEIQFERTYSGAPVVIISGIARAQGN
jgi:hypothetical protein